MKRGLLVSLVSILFCIGALEAALRIADPLGVVYFDDIGYLWSTRHEAAHGYDHIPGSYTLGDRFGFTIMPDGNRYTPGAWRGGPRVTFVGDSQTFGYGVNDAETWVSRVASALRIDALNIARSGYNIENIASQLEGVTGCVVWLTISNDPGAAVRYSDAGNDPHSYIGNTLRVLYSSQASYTTAPITDAVRPLYEAIAARPNTLIIALDDNNYGKIVREKYGALIIPYFTSRISPTDAHADSEGNRQIAEAVLPILDNWLDERNCT